jgi:KDO2-lipid IV(A) lauroyltransferase
MERTLGLSYRQRVGLAQQVYNHLCKGALEFIQLDRLTAHQARVIIGDPAISKLRDLLAPGKGLLVLSAHLGNWDLLACATALCGFHVNVISREIKNSRINQYWMDRRKRCGINILSARGSAWQILRALRKNEIVAVVLDQHEPDGIPIPFLGQPAATSTALARLALASDAPVVPAFLLWDGFRYRVEIYDPICLERTNNRQFDVVQNTKKFSDIIAAQVRKAPQQWLWLHRRWKVDA